MVLINKSGSSLDFLETYKMVLVIFHMSLDYTFRAEQVDIHNYHYTSEDDLTNSKIPNYSTQETKRHCGNSLPRRGRVV